VTYRYELEWKDKVFVDVTYSTVAPNTVLAAMHCVNNSALPQNLVLNLMASLEHPEVFPSVKAQTTGDSRWINAVDYQQLTFAHARPTDNLVYDGWLRGEVRSNDYVGGSAIGQGVRQRPRRQGHYAIPASWRRAPARSPPLSAERGRTRGLQIQRPRQSEMDFIGTGKFEMLEVPFSPSAAARTSWFLNQKVEARSSSMVFLSFPRKTAKKVRPLLPVEKKFTPEIKPAGEKSLILKYDEVENYTASPGIFAVRGPGIFER